MVGSLVVQVIVAAKGVRPEINTFEMIGGVMSAPGVGVGVIVGLGVGVGVTVGVGVLVGVGVAVGVGVVVGTVVGVVVNTVVSTVDAVVVPVCAPHPDGCARRRHRPRRDRARRRAGTGPSSAA